MSDPLVPADVVVPETEPGGRIFATAVNTLHSIAAIYKTAGVQLPEFRYVSDGNVAYDISEGQDGFVALQPTALRPGRPGIPSASAVGPATVFSLEMILHVIRRAPTQNDAGDPPTAETLTKSAGLFLTDWWTLLNGVQLGRARGAYGLPGDLQAAPYREIMIQEILPYGPVDVGGMLATLNAELV